MRVDESEHEENFIYSGGRMTILAISAKFLDSLHTILIRQTQIRIYEVP
jgi:hypothetical protein